VIAILVHKGAAASSLGVSLVKTFPKDFTLVRTLVLIFSLATPVGVVIGILCSGAGDIVDVVMSSLAGGTFIYIGCTEMVVQEFSTSGGRCVKLFAYLCGAMLITSLSFIPGT
jgi:zinc transporter 1/2/3